MELTPLQLKKYKTSNTIYILGSGPSILDITKEEWNHIKNHNSIGFNHWYAHGYEPTFYDLSYLADNDFKGKDSNMYYQASVRCKNSKFILNKQITPNNLEYFKNNIHSKIHVNHFDFFDQDMSLINNEKSTNIGTHASYWTEEFFKVFNNPKGELLPNENYIYKSRSQLFATIQICVLLGYNDIRLVGIDLNSESKFQDNLPNAPYSSKSPYSSDKTLESRNHHMNNAKELGGVHNTAQGTKDKDYLGIHKLIYIFEQNCLKRIGVSLTATNKKSLMVKAGIKFQPLTEDLKIPKITFCIPSKTNLRYLKTCIPSIRENAYRKDHDIIVFVDSDEDGTVEWLKEAKDKYNIEYHVNPKLGEELYGIGMAYDFCIKKSTTDIFMIFHADMMLGKNADLKAFQHLKPKTVVCSTRIEPPLHPNGGEKILLDFGMWPEEFKKEEFNQYVEEHFGDTKTTEGIFAPWMMYKDEFLDLGGHDPRMHSCREDSDVFNRMHLDGFTFIQPWSSLVYHLTGRGAGSFGGDKKRHEQWKKDMNISTLEFIRKWGQNVNHTPLMKPIVYPVYKKSIIINNPNPGIEATLEPWFNGGDDIVVEIDGNTFNQQDFQYIQQLSAIIQDSGEIGTFNLGNLKITINSLNTHEKDLIICEK
tara:strand:+ start:903 stop:2843 length:1941 start_codon:yes stop_codon:yes gene_type:complete